MNTVCKLIRLLATVTQIKDSDFERIDLNGLKLIPGGIQIGFRDGNIGQFEKFVEKQYLYNTGTWDKVNTDTIATGAQATKTFAYIDQTYPERFKEYDKENNDGFSDLVLPDTNEVFQVNGRDNDIVSPVIDGTRYVLTNASIDIIDDSSS